MKRLCLIMAISILQLYTFAQVNGFTYKYRIGDKIYRTTIENFNIGNTADSCIWDYSDIKTHDSFSTEYASDYEHKDIIAKIYKNTRYYYLQDSVSINNVGYENNNISVEYDKPQTILLFPLLYGKKKEGVFHGSCMYCENTYSRIFGIYSIEVDGKGKLLLPEGKTINEVYRIHTSKRACQAIYENIHTNSELEEYIYKAHPFTEDSIKNIISNSKNSVSCIEAYTWYAKDYRYPIIEAFVYGKNENGINRAIAYYCVPKEQEKLYDIENEKTRKETNSKESPQNVGELRSEKKGNSLQYDIITNRNNVIIKNQTDYEIYITVADSVGITYKSTCGKPQSDSYLDITGLKHGEYIICIRISGTIFTEKINI